MPTIERWLTGHVWVRCFTLAALTGLALLLIWQGMLRPQQLTRELLAGQNQQIAHQLNVLRRKTVAIPAIQKQDEVITPQPFSVTAFIKRCGGQLIAWQPGDKKAELQIRVSWEKLPGLFDYLAQYDALRLSSLSIETNNLEPKELSLQVSLVLEFVDEV